MNPVSNPQIGGLDGAPPKARLSEASRRQHPQALPQLTVADALKALAFGGLMFAATYLVFGVF